MKTYLFVFLAMIIYSCNTDQGQNTLDDSVNNMTVEPPQVTVLADLNDSLQPKSFILSDRPKPLIVMVPERYGGSYFYMNSKGEKIKVNKEPPIKQPLPILQDEKGETVLDNNKNPFILGEGGISNFTKYTTDNGLAMDGFGNGKSILCDRNGNLWFGTGGGGASKYDGKTFSNYTSAQGLIHNHIYCIAEDRLGNIWFGTLGGVSKYDGKSFTNYTTANGLVHNYVYCITEDKHGNIWFGSKGGISKFDGKSFSSMTIAQGLINNNVWSIAEDRKGNLWIGTEGGVMKYDGKSFLSYTTADGLPHNLVWSIVEDKKGNIWFGTKGGASVLNENGFTTISSMQGFARYNVKGIVEDRSGNIWFGTEGNGLCKYDGKSTTTYTTSQGLVQNNILSIAEDKQGNLWFGTMGGLSKYDGNLFSTFTTVQGLAQNNVRSIMADKHRNIWFGTLGGGVSKFDGKSFNTYTEAQGLCSNNIFSMVEDKNGNIWFGSSGGGVCKFDGKSFTNFTTVHGLTHNSILSIAEDKDGNLWFGSLNGLTKYDGKTFTRYTKSQGFTNSPVISVMLDQSGNLWFGTEGGGVYKFDGQSFTGYTTSQGLANNFVGSIVQDRIGNIWFGTDLGISIMSSDQANKKGHHKSDLIFRNLTKNNGLYDNTICSIREDKLGNMIVGTNFGLFVIPQKEVESITKSNPKESIHISGLDIYNQFTGFPVRDVNYGGSNGAMLIDSNGVLWVGHGNNGVTRFDVQAVHKNTEPPKVVLKSVSVNEENICWFDLNLMEHDSTLLSQQEKMTFGKILSGKERSNILDKYRAIRFDSILGFNPIPFHLSLPFEHNNISFDFVANETGRNDMVRYQYMLDGYDKDWSPVTNKTSATFGNISEGDYIFKLKAMSPFGIWSEPITYSFKVLPPWYRTWWMYMIYVFSFLITLRMFIKYRESALVKEKEILEAKVALRTAELDERNKLVEEQKATVEFEKDKSDKLLLNILPEEVADELKQYGTASAKQYEEVTVLFTDFVNFTGISEKMTPKELVNEIHQNFSAFDAIIEKHGLEKIKTIGDAYMAVCGLPVATQDHAQRTIHAALDICDYVAKNGGKFQIRIGIHSGPVVAGIVGVKKYAYDIWGDTVNTASRMESTSVAGKVNISGSTYELVKDKFICSHRGKIQVKHKGELDMYYVERVV